MSLVNKYSWKELAELTATRLEKELAPKDMKKWNREHFIEWFMVREKVGYTIDWRLIGRAYMIWQQLQKESDHFTVIVGREGVGKTTLGANLSSWVAPRMNLDDVCFNMYGYVGRLQKAAKNYKKNKFEGISRSIMIDEGGIDLFSREALSKSNKILGKTFMVQRFLNVHVCINIPNWWMLDSLVRDHRVNTLIVIKERGKYECIVGKGIKILNKLGKKDKDKELWAIPIPYGLFWEGNFNKDFPSTIDTKDYDKHKFKHIQSFLEDARLEASTVKMVKVGILEKELGVKRDTIIAQIHSGDIEGRKIGNQWFITKKAYEKLMMMGV